LHIKQLGGQVNETDQMLNALEHGLDNWIARHPATQSWFNHYAALVLYGVIIYREWQRRFVDGERGGKLKHKSGERILDRWAEIGCPVAVCWPEWLNDARLMKNHRGRLLHKKPAHYGVFGWDVEPTEESWYPVWEKE